MVRVEISRPKIGEILIYDTFIFFNELDLLEIRLNILDKTVDKFVLVEATKTFQGNEKPLYFQQNKSRFEKFNAKIIHVIVDDVPSHATSWEREYFQRNAILRGLTTCSEMDLILISDLDEIPNPEVIPTFLDKHRIGAFQQRLFYYKLDTKCVELQHLPWSIIVTFNISISPAQLRKRLVETQSSLLAGSLVSEDVQLIENGGWHFSYLGSPEQIVAKIESFSHVELNTPEFKDAKTIGDLIVNGKDIFGRELSFVTATSDELPKYIVDNMSMYGEKGFLAFPSPDVGEIESPNVCQILFDQYSRYKACSDILYQVGFAAGNTLLDIGSGPECLFGQFMPDANINYVDPLIPKGAGEGRITGNVFCNELDGQAFDCVSAVDVLEHVPPEHRLKFVRRLASLAMNTVILGFPTSDSSAALETDQAIDEQYHEVYGHKYSWLEEHYRYGLPSMAETVQQLTDLGWHCQTVGHGHAPWLRELLGYVICAWDIPSMGALVQEISERFNRELYAYDFIAPHYRQFIIATRNPLPPRIVFESKTGGVAAEATFRALMDQARNRYFSTSLRQFAERDIQIALLNKKIEESSAWGAAQQSAIVERDVLITSLNRKIEEASAWGTAQQATIVERDALIAVQEKVLSDKQAELMKMSDWAQGMMLEINQRNVPVVSKIQKFVNRVVAFLRKKLAKSYIGDLVRYARDVRSFGEKRVSLDVIRNSVAENNGRLIVTFPIITWNFRWQRPQHIVSRLRDRGFSVLYVAMSMSPLGRRFRNKKEALSLMSFNELVPGVNKIWINSSKQINVYVDPIEGDDLQNISMGLEALISELRPKSVIYLIQFPGWGAVALDLRSKLGGKVIFDCMDDHGGFSTNTQQALQTEEALIKNSDLVIASSNVLEEKAKLFNPHTIQVKNGTEFEHFANPIPNGKLDHLRNRPIVGYYGAISDWFDVEIVAYCARQRPDWNFVLVGATAGADLKPIIDSNNVHLLGEVPYKELPGYFAYFDVCTIPFKIIPLTMATNPVKFYEYLSAGKPVVSVALPELLPYEEDCYLARNAEDFLVQLDRAFKERDDQEKIQRRKTLASNNSWDARVSTILDSDIFASYLR
jgi:glycosyltransferase involved in cell wall biosynthesis/cyclopropane fatty-acyl-phospholipid synthase-like methyltransferase